MAFICVIAGGWIGQGGGGVLLVAVGVRKGGQFGVPDWQAEVEETADAYVQLFTRLWQRGWRSWSC